MPRGSENAKKTDFSAISAVTPRGTRGYLPGRGLSDVAFRDLELHYATAPLPVGLPI